VSQPSFWDLNNCAAPNKISNKRRARERVPLKRLFLITLLVLSHSFAYAKWVVVEKNNQSAGLMTVYVDPDTIRRKENLATLWQLIDYKTMQGGRSPSRFSSRKIQKQFDCVKKRLRLLALTDFWGNMGTGEPTGAYIDGGNWVPVEPDSIDQTLWEFACDKQWSRSGQ
jgi:hypothetical protein